MKEYKLYPADQRVVVLPHKKEESKTKMGIILPGTNQEHRPEIATIVEVGEGRKDHPMEYVVGQIVMFSDYAGIPISINLHGYGHDTYKVMDQADIIGRLKLIEE